MEKVTYTREEIPAREQAVKEAVREIRGNSQRDLTEEEVTRAQERVEEIVQRRL